jgi:hypothetical protein
VPERPVDRRPAQARHLLHAGRDQAPHRERCPLVDRRGRLREHEASFALADDETAAGALAAFDATRVGYLAALAAVDPSAPTIEEPAPWFGIFDNRPARARYLLVHQVEEMARHAGHADIIREEIDGMSVPAIVLTADGMTKSDFFQPYVPEPGTIGA